MLLTHLLQEKKIIKIGFYLKNTTNTNTSMLIIVFILFKLLLLCMNTVGRFPTCNGLSIEASGHSMIQMWMLGVRKSIIIFIAMELLNVSYIMKTFEISSKLFAYRQTHIHMIHSEKRFFYG